MTNILLFTFREDSKTRLVIHTRCQRPTSKKLIDQSGPVVPITFVLLTKWNMILFFIFKLYLKKRVYFQIIFSVCFFTYAKMLRMYNQTPSGHSIVLRSPYDVPFHFKLNIQKLQVRCLFLFGGVCSVKAILVSTQSSTVSKVRGPLVNPRFHVCDNCAPILY